MSIFDKRAAAIGMALAIAVPFAGAMAPIVAGAQGAPLRAECASDRNLWSVHGHLDVAIDRLSHDRHDYHGHRVNAIGDLQQARADLVAAEAYDRAHFDNGEARCAPYAVLGADPDHEGAGMRGQPGSNRNIQFVRQAVERMMVQLGRDRRDYGGRRVAAIGALQSASNELLAAMRYR